MNRRGARVLWAVALSAVIAAAGPAGATCPDNIVTSPEECDDGNTTSGDGCFSTCHFEEELTLFGLAQGGTVSVSIFGVVEQETTAAGETGADVLQSLVDKINTNNILTALGVSAILLGDRLVTNGSIDGVSFTDAGFSECATLAASAPDGIHYQGVLRDASDHPLDGNYDMVFRLYDAETGGNEILIDTHTTAQSEAVTVSGGLFSTELGGGLIEDGSGPGTFGTLSEAFRAHTGVWLDIQVDAETLSPRTKVLSAPYALSAEFLEGRSGSQYLDTSETVQTKAGGLVVYPGSAFDAIDVHGHVYAENSNGSWFRAPVADFGIDARGIASGGKFRDIDGSGVAEVGHGDRGITAQGDEMGGLFLESDGSGVAHLAEGDQGVVASGNLWGGVFGDSSGTGVGYVGRDHYGIWAYGNESGGRFQDPLSSGLGYAGRGDYGFMGYGNTSGGYFEDTDASGYAYAGFGNHGIDGYGSNAGGYFADIDAAGFARVGSGSFKIIGNGTVSFVQNHPEDPEKVIVYHAPEASEVAVYTRGSGLLAGGVARLQLDPTFEWVTNPDLGLTAHLTPRGHAVPLAVASLSTTELLVEGPEDVAFDYLVYGLRIGFEESSVVWPKLEEAWIPSMSDHRDLYAQDAELRQFNALERFKVLEADVRGRDELDLSRSEELLTRIGEFDPAVHGIQDRRPHDLDPQPPELEPDGASVEIESGGLEQLDPAVPAPVSRSADKGSPKSPRRGNAADPAVAGHDSIEVSERVERGDVLALDLDRPGLLKRAASIADPTVVGVAVGPAEPAADGNGFDAPVATSGIVTLKVDAGFGAIRAGDLLVSSPTPGHAMRAFEILPGTLLGKALEPLGTGTRAIRVLLTLR